MNSQKYVFLTSVFVACLVVSNMIASKLVMVGAFVFPAAVVAYPITFLITDVVGEVYGKRAATKVVHAGLIASVFMVLLVWLGKMLPPAPFWDGQEAYEMILSGTPRIVFASLVAYFISQTHDVWSFHFWKKKTNGKHLWWRNNASTITSQIIDTVVFIGLAFGGVLPGSVLIGMMFSQYAIKVGVALADTPFCYLLVHWLEKEAR
ncbi:MAG: queuosine precursor transporter [Limnochordia bacterium]|nr:queuosine precursor transporter [Limnochordia bacterium]